MEQNKFKPFERILIKIKSNYLSNAYKWTCCEFSHYDDNFICLVVGVSHDLSSVDVLPFAGNENLAGTSDMPETIELKNGEYIMACKDDIEYIMPSFWKFRIFKGVDRLCIKTNTDEDYALCVQFSKFNPKDMAETMKHILCVKNGKLVKAF